MAPSHAAPDAHGGYGYHVLNRGNGRRTVFHKDADFACLRDLLREAGERVDVRLLAYCVMPNHFHLALWPRADDDLSDYMMWADHRTCPPLTSALSLQRPRLARTLSVVFHPGRRPSLDGPPLHRTQSGSGGLVDRAQDWLWFSAAPPPADRALLDLGPVPRPASWFAHVNQPQTDAEVERLREWLRRRRPFGDEVWTQHTARRMGLGASQRPRGRPRKQACEYVSVVRDDDAAK